MILSAGVRAQAEPQLAARPRSFLWTHNLALPLPARPAPHRTVQPSSTRRPASPGFPLSGRYPRALGPDVVPCDSAAPLRCGQRLLLPHLRPGWRSATPARQTRPGESAGRSRPSAPRVGPATLGLWVGLAPALLPLSGAGVACAAPAGSRTASAVSAHGRIRS